MHICLLLTSLLASDDRIIICGGQDGVQQPFHTYLSSQGDTSAMTAILDTTQWTWSIPDASPYQPFPRSFAAASIVNGSKMVYGFGKQ